MKDIELTFDNNKVDIKQISDALSSKTRIKILEVIKNTHNLNHKDIADIIGMSESSITHHIRYLLDCGILVEESMKGTKGRLKKVPKIKVGKIIIGL